MKFVIFGAALVLLASVINAQTESEPQPQSVLLEVLSNADSTGANKEVTREKRQFGYGE